MLINFLIDCDKKEKANKKIFYLCEKQSIPNLFHRSKTNTNVLKLVPWMNLEPFLFIYYSHRHGNPLHGSFRSQENLRRTEKIIKGNSSLYLE